MRVLLTTGFAAAAIVVAGLLPAQPPCLDPAAPTKEIPAGLAFPAVDADLPFDVTRPTMVTLENDQKAFDLFSWDSFVALNWPAGKDGKPLAGKIGDHATAPRLWETFLATARVIKRDGSAPDPWGAKNHFAFLNKKLASKLAARKAAPRRVLVATHKNTLEDILQAGVGPGKFPPIADTNGNYVFYEQYLNKVEYDYIVSNQLYTEDGQTSFLKAGKKVDFPRGSAGASRVGAIEIKVMWMQLGKGHDRNKFYAIDAIRVDPVTHAPSATTVPFGLVGMHIVTRTEKAPEWVWSTFEHVDNAPDVGETMLKPRYNFNEPTKPQPPGGFKLPMPKLDAIPNPTPTQITRVLSNKLVSSPWTKALNEAMQAKLKDTVWANYRLVSTQWPSPTGQPIPCRLTNTVAETYVQQGQSCMACHKLAVTAGKDQNGQKGSANFSYVLQLARPAAKGAGAGTRP